MKIQKPEVTTQYVRIPVARRKKTDRIVTITISTKKGIKALYAGNRKVVLTYLFSKAKGWTMSKARAWIKSHKTSKSILKAINKNMNKNRFKFTLPITKTKVKIVKDEDGNEKEERYIIGKASDTDIDLVKDRMDKSAIKSMAASLKQHMINMNAEHSDAWMFDLGDIMGLKVTKNYDLMFESKLNEMSTSKDLWYALTELKKKLGVSIGGYVKDYDWEEDKDGEPIRVFKDVELDHIAIVSEPAHPKTWLEAITKSLDPNAEKTKTLDKKKLKTLLTDAGREDVIDDILNLINTPMNKKKTSLEADKKKSATPDNGDKKVDKKKDKETKKVKKVKKEIEKKDKKSTIKKVEKKTSKTKKDLSTASAVMAATKELKYAINWLEYKGKDTGNLEIALEDLKKEAAKQLKEKEAKKSTKSKAADKKSDTSKKVKKIKKVKKTKMTIVKALDKLTKSVDKKLGVIEKKLEKLDVRLEEVETAPADRKGIDVKKGIGSDMDGEYEDEKVLEKKLEKEIEEVREKYKGDSNRAFTESQRIRQTYKDNYGIG